MVEGVWLLLLLLSTLPLKAAIFLVWERKHKMQIWVCFLRSGPAPLRAQSPRKPTATVCFSSLHVRTEAGTQPLLQAIHWYNISRHPPARWFNSKLPVWVDTCQKKKKMLKHYHWVYESYQFAFWRFFFFFTDDPVLFQLSGILGLSSDHLGWALKPNSYWLLLMAHWTELSWRKML